MVTDEQAKRLTMGEDPSLRSRTRMAMPSRTGKPVQKSKRNSARLVVGRWLIRGLGMGDVFSVYFLPNQWDSGKCYWCFLCRAVPCTEVG